MTHPKKKKTNYCTIHYDEDITIATVTDSWDSIVACYFYHAFQNPCNYPSYHMQDEYVVAFVGKSGKIYLYSEHLFAIDCSKVFNSSHVYDAVFYRSLDNPLRNILLRVGEWNTVPNYVTKYGDSVKALFVPGYNKKEL
ncbi:hypothetical protein ABK040_013650 [Willaertia magna]